MSAARSLPGTARCALTLVLVKLALLTVGFGRALRAARWLVRHSAAGTGDQGGMAQLAHRVALAAAFFPGRALCLEQSFTLWLLLRRQGWEAELRLGVRPYPFGAHAWVEHGGTPLNEDAELVRSFVTLPEFAR